MASKKRSSALKISATAPKLKKTQAADDRKEPFALVYYTETRKKGVVEVKHIAKKDRISGKGTLCKVPNPIDWDPEGKVRSTDRTQPATIIEFGYNVDFLYGIKLLTDGTIRPDGSSEGVLAEKKTRSLQDKIVRAIKDTNLRNIDSRVSLRRSLIRNPMPTGENNSEPTSETSLAEGNVEVSTLESTNIQSAGDQTFPIESNLEVSTVEGADEHIEDESEKTEPPPFHQDVIVVSDVTQQQSDSISVLGISFSGEFMQSNIPSISTAATQEVLQGEMDNDTRNEVIIDLDSAEDSTLPCCSFECPVKSILSSASPGKIKWLKGLVRAMDQHLTSRNPEPSAAVAKSRLELKFEDLECSKAGDKENVKYLMVKGLPVYLSKHDFFSLPHIAADDSDKNGIKPLEAVKPLVDKLIPKSTQVLITVTNTPDLVVKAISTYINQRLPPTKRLKDREIRNKIYNVCRLNRPRDRQAETKRLQERKQNNTYIPRIKNKEK